MDDTQDNKPALMNSRAMTDVETSKAIEEVRASMTIAKKFPRDEITAEQRILTSCKRFSLAERALYSFPRGGKAVSGPSIRLAEVIAQNWGNIQFGIKELEMNDQRATVEAYAHDLETNTRQSRVFTVEFKIQLSGNKGFKTLTDPRDRYELIANYGMRRTRACLLSIIPGDIVERAVETCQKTLENGEKSEPFIDRVRRMVSAFAELGVTKDLIEKKLGHTLEMMIPKELVDMQGIFASIRDGMTRREDWFEMAKEKPTNISSLNEKLGITAQEETKNEDK